MSLNWRLRKPAARAVWIVPLLLGLAGCSSSVYGPVGPAPADSVTFPAASTQGWLQQYGTGYTGTHSRNGDSAYGVAADLQGNVIVLDQTYGAFPGFTNTGSAQFAVVKFNSSGTLVWTQQFGTGAGDYPNAITTDPQGNIYVAGFTNGAFSGFTNSGPQQSVVIKLNSSGQTQWIQQFASYGPSQATSLGVDPQGNLIVGGVNVVRASNGGRVQLGYVSKLAGATGAVMWTQGNSSSGVYYFVTGVSADPSGNVIAVGDFQGTGNTNGTTYMIAKLSGTNGTIQWQQAPVT
ncbi:MAG: SBBP repeat-containing protein, partial [Acidobacteriaceae bacterium]